MSDGRLYLAFMRTESGNTAVFVAAAPQQGTPGARDPCLTAFYPGWPALIITSPLNG